MLAILGWSRTWFADRGGRNSCALSHFTGMEIRSSREVQVEPKWWKPFPAPQPICFQHHGTNLASVRTPFCHLIDTHGNDRLRQEDQYQKRIQFLRVSSRYLPTIVTVVMIALLLGLNPESIQFAWASEERVPNSLSTHEQIFVTIPKRELLLGLSN
jgi:hypothetical protein